MSGMTRGRILPSVTPPKSPAWEAGKPTSAVTPPSPRGTYIPWIEWVWQHPGEKDLSETITLLCGGYDFDKINSDIEAASKAIQEDASELQRRFGNDRRLGHDSLTEWRSFAPTIARLAEAHEIGPTYIAATAYEVLRKPPTPCIENRPPPGTETAHPLYRKPPIGWSLRRLPI